MILSGRAVTISRTRIVYGPNALDDLHKLLSSQNYSKSRVFILLDPNTGKHCLPVLIKACPELDSASVFEIEEGEPSKSLAAAGKIWGELLTAHADRHSLLINLGGGVVTDLGGFVAAGLKRGINFINTPTSLMGMADAAIGGKTGVNLQHLKNQIGFFYSPIAVFIDPRFLKTLPADHIRSGFAEIIKSALIGDPVLWRKILKLDVGNILSMDTSEKLWQDLIMKTITFKNRIACQDFRETKLRKILNFGHTIGHALESFFIDKAGNNLLHGDAVAFGMIAESWLSNIRAGLSEVEADQIISFLKSGYKPQIEVLKNSMKSPASAFDSICDLILHDKKTKEGQIRYTLLQTVGKPKINVTADRNETTAALSKLFD